MRGKHSASRPVPIQVHHFSGARRLENIQVLNDELIFLRPAHSQARLVVERAAVLLGRRHAAARRVLRVQQIKYFLVVYLKEGDEDREVSRAFALLDDLDSLE